MKKDTIYKEIFNLVRGTGEKLVIINPDTDDAVVVLRLSDYEKMKLNSEQNVEVVKNDENDTINQQNFSFWNEQQKNDQTLDTTENSGRIDSLDSHKSGGDALFNNDASSLDTDEEDSEREDAGGGYVFEPIESEEPNT